MGGRWRGRRFVRDHQRLLCWSVGVTLAVVQIGGAVAGVVGNYRREASPKSSAHRSAFLPAQFTERTVVIRTPDSVAAGEAGSGASEPSASTPNIAAPAYPVPLVAASPPPATAASPAVPPSTSQVPSNAPPVTTNYTPPVSTYTVQPGDGLISVASTLGVSETDLATANGLSPTDWLVVGQVLRVPAAAGAPAVMLK
jgi:LysM repeat protein